MKPTLLKQIRTQQGLKQLEIANKVNISLMSYQRYEYGERVPDVYTAQLIAQALHTTVEELFPLPASANAGGDKPNNKQA